MDYWGGPKGMLAPLSNYWGGLPPPPPWPPLFLRLCNNINMSIHFYLPPHDHIPIIVLRSPVKVTVNSLAAGCQSFYLKSTDIFYSMLFVSKRNLLHIFIRSSILVLKFIFLQNTQRTTAKNANTQVTIETINTADLRWLEH